MPVVPVPSGGLNAISEIETAIGSIGSGNKLGRPLANWANYLFGVKQGGPVVMQMTDTDQKDIAEGVYNYKFFVYPNTRGYKCVGLYQQLVVPATLDIQIGTAPAISITGSSMEEGGWSKFEETVIALEAEQGTYVDAVVTITNADLYSLTIIPLAQANLFTDAPFSDNAVVPNSRLSLEGGVNEGKYIHSGGPTNAGSQDMQDIYEKIIIGVEDERRLLYSWANPAVNIFIGGAVWDDFFPTDAFTRQPQFDSDTAWDVRLYFRTHADFKGVGTQYEFRALTDTETVVSGVLTNEAAAWYSIDIKVKTSVEGDSIRVQAQTDHANALVHLTGLGIQRLVT